MSNLAGSLIPGWIPLGWVVLSHASTAQFTISFFSAATRFLNKNPSYGLVIGFGWLTIILLWPKINDKMPAWIRIPKTSGERLNVIESMHLPAPNQKHSDLGRGLSSLESRVGSLEAGLKEALKLQNRLAENVNQMFETSRSTVDTHLTALETMKAQVWRTPEALRSLLTFTVDLDDYADLVHQVDMATVMRSAQESDSLPERAAFSKRWRLASLRG